MQLQSLKQGHLKEAEIQKEDIETLLASLESYKTYCKQITTMGSSRDICESVNSLTKRAKELKNMYCATETIEMCVKDVSLRRTDNFRQSDDTNIIGEIEGKTS